MQAASPNLCGSHDRGFLSPWITHSREEGNSRAEDSPPRCGDDLGGEVSLQFIFVSDLVGKSGTCHPFASPLSGPRPGVTTKAWGSGNKRKTSVGVGLTVHRSLTLPLRLDAARRGPLGWQENGIQPRAHRPKSCHPAEALVKKISVVLYTSLAMSDDRCHRAGGMFAVFCGRLREHKQSG